MTLHESSSSEGGGDGDGGGDGIGDGGGGRGGGGGGVGDGGGGGLVGGRGGDGHELAVSHDAPGEVPPCSAQSAWGTRGVKQRYWVRMHGVSVSHGWYSRWVRTGQRAQSSIPVPVGGRARTIEDALLEGLWGATRAGLLAAHAGSAAVGECALLLQVPPQ